MAFDLKGDVGRRGSFPDLEFEELAGDRAVHQRDAVARAEAEVRKRGRVGRQDRSPPTAAPLHQPVAQPPKKGSGPRERQPLTVRRIRDDQAGGLRRNHVFEVLGIDRDRRHDAGRFRAGPCRFDCLGVEVAGEEAGSGQRTNS